MMLDFCILLLECIMDRLEMTVVSPKFKGMKLLQQHRMLNKVYLFQLNDLQILSDELSILHGITFKCYTPEEYAQQNDK